MNKRRTKTHPHFVFKIVPYAGANYIEDVYRLESLLNKRPHCLQIDLVGSGQVPADMALLVRSVLQNRGQTHVITNARSSLSGPAVLIWLLGDTRVIRGDARVYFQPCKQSGPDVEPEEEEPWDDEERLFDFTDNGELEDADYSRVLQLINQFLPVRELAGRVVEVEELKQFGLVDSEQVDHLLSKAFARPKLESESTTPPPAKKLAPEDSEKPKKL